MLDLASSLYFSVFGLATECMSSNSYLNTRLMNILNSVDPGSVSHFGVLSGLASTQMLSARISSISTSKADLNKLLRSYYNIS